MKQNFEIPATFFRCLFRVCKERLYIRKAHVPGQHDADEIIALQDRAQFGMALFVSARKKVQNQHFDFVKCREIMDFFPVRFIQRCILPRYADERHFPVLFPDKITECVEKDRQHLIMDMRVETEAAFGACSAIIHLTEIRAEIGQTPRDLRLHLLLNLLIVDLTDKRIAGSEKQLPERNTEDAAAVRQMRYFFCRRKGFPFDQIQVNRQLQVFADRADKFHTFFKTRAVRHDTDAV